MSTENNRHPVCHFCPPFFLNLATTREFLVCMGIDVCNQEEANRTETFNRNSNLTVVVTCLYYMTNKNKHYIYAPCCTYSYA